MQHHTIKKTTQFMICRSKLTRLKEVQCSLLLSL